MRITKALISLHGCAGWSAPLLFANHDDKFSRAKVHIKVHYIPGSYRLEKYLNLEGFLEKSLKIKSALKSTGKSLKGLEKSLNSSIFCRN